MNADYPGAIVVEAANYGYATENRPKTWGFHTPEEPADSHPSTPEYLAVTDRDASYTYFVSYLAFVFQLVPESEGAYAHGLDGKPAPSWSDGTNLNLQSLSLSFEGHAATIHQTMPRGSPQWSAGVDLVAHRTKARGLNLDIAFQHKDVSIYRGDCGQWDQVAFIADVKAKLIEEDDMIPIHLHNRSGTPFGLIGWLTHPLTGGAHAAAHAAGSQDVILEDDVLADLTDFGEGLRISLPSGGTGASAAQVADELHRRLAG